MNFSNQHKFCKVLSLVLVLILMCTLFAGCQKEDDETDNTSGAGSNLSLIDDTNPTDASTQTEETEPTVVTGENMGTVTSQMNVRVTPSTDATVVGTLYAGDRVEVTRQETVVGINWGYITEPEGWIVMDYVAMDNPDTSANNTTTPASTEPSSTTSSEGDTTTTSTKGVITGTTVNIRDEASTSGKIVGSYTKGDVVTILETKDGWGRTSLGWVKMDYVSTTSTTTGTTTNTTTGTTNNTTTTTTTTVTGNGSTTVVAKGIVIASQLNVRATASTEGDKLGTLSYGDRVEIYETSGNWGRTSDGWIYMDYIYKDGTTGTNTATGTVTANQLNIRSGPGTGYESVGSYTAGTTVTILEQFTYNGVKWGCTSKGWISMQYVDTGDSSSDDDDTSTDEQLYGTVTAVGGLRIRSGAGSSYTVVGSLDYGEEVVITSRTIADDTTWGKISQGWICLDYVDLS